MDKVRVRVDLTIEVNRAAWADLYGVDPESVPEDVRKYAVNQLWESSAVAERAVFSVGLMPHPLAGGM